MSFLDSAGNDTSNVVPSVAIYGVRELQKIWELSYQLLRHFSPQPEEFAKVAAEICKVKKVDNLTKSIVHAYRILNVKDKRTRLLLCVRIAWFRNIFDVSSIDLSLRDYGSGVWGAARILDVRPHGNRKKIRFLVLTGKAAGELIEKSVSDKFIYYIAKSLTLKLKAQLDRPSYRDYRHPTDICGAFVILKIGSRAKHLQIVNISIPQNYITYYLKVLKARYNKDGCLIPKSAQNRVCYLCSKTLYGCNLAVHCFFKKAVPCSICHNNPAQIDNMCLLCLWHRPQSERSRHVCTSR